MKDYTITKEEAIEYIKFYLMDGRWVDGQVPRNFVRDEKWQAGEMAIEALKGGEGRMTNELRVGDRVNLTREVVEGFKVVDEIVEEYIITDIFFEDYTLTGGGWKTIVKAKRKVITEAEPEGFWFQETFFENEFCSKIRSEEE